MKAIKVTYWATTAIIALMMTYSAYAYLTKPEMDQAFRHIGYPAYFRIELAIAKLIGVVLLVLPLVHGRLKEWTYAGFAFTFVSAAIAHAASGDPMPNPVVPVVFLGILAASYFTYHKLKK
ncbi:DoxX family protein [Chitinophaga pinensis]|uniref:DoxX family protein n=1 Tax=Chitinophaga pinensis TaxID=79329 RepID=A0A5C6LWK3_9BACT|nr:DoxX family protein [Chitinophaga pinensis]TWW01212.1 DoxX family protein [Chitinophaga pinensis]